MANRISTLFDRAAQWAARQCGRAHTFAIAVGVVLVWAITGPLFQFSDTWQLVINTGTTIVTFLMVFLNAPTRPADSPAGGDAWRFHPGGTSSPCALAIRWTKRIRLFTPVSSVPMRSVRWATESSSAAVLASSATIRSVRLLSSKISRRFTPDTLFCKPSNRRATDSRDTVSLIGATRSPAMPP